MWHTLHRILTALWVGLLVPVVGLAALLAVVAETAGGRLCGVGFFVGGLAAMLLAVAPLLPSGRQAVRPGAAGLGVFVACVLGAAGVAPSGVSPPGARITSVWAGDATYPRWSLANLVPEIDQFKMGTWLVAVDPHIDLAQSAALRDMFLAVYRDMRTDPDTVEAGSSMHFAYRDLFTGRASSGHLYVVRPAVESSKPASTALFLHGTLGSFKGYAHVLRGLADRCGLTIIAPDYGAGFWFREGGPRAVADAVAWADSQPALDAPRTLIGLSGGGFGVSRAAVDMPHQWDEVVYLSGILESDWMGPVATAANRPITVVWGEQDRRLSHGHTLAGIEGLEAAGARVRRLSWPEEDHFLFFSQPEAVLDALAASLSTCGAP